MNAPPLDFQLQPWEATDVAAFVFAVLAVLYATLWRDREAGMSWFALAYAALAALYAFHRSLLPATPNNPLALTLSWTAMLSTLVGMTRYLNIPPALQRRVLGLAALPFLFVVGWRLSGVPVVRPYAQMPVLAATFLGAYMAMWAARREPGVGHGYIGAALLAIPLFVLAMTLLHGSDAFLVRYYALPPMILFGLTLLTTSLTRRRRLLEAEVERRANAEAAWIELNAQLEGRVAERTADLSRMVDGLETFNRSVAHDLNGLLGGIAGTARLAELALRDEQDDAVARRVLPLIVAQAEVSTQLVASLMSLARVGESEINRSRVDLSALVRDVVQQMPSPGGQPLPPIDVAEMPPVHADAKLLWPVLLNLLGNAVKFTRGLPRPRIEVSAWDSGDAVTVQVRDNGVGFTMDAARTLFQPFTRLHGEDYEGHGVGLSIVRRAVERHGGRVWAESTPGRGATFLFTLPQAPSGPAA